MTLAPTMLAENGLTQVAEDVIVRTGWDERSLEYAPQRFRSRVELVGECWQFVGYIDKDGYGRYNDRATGEQMAHRFSLRWFAGDFPRECQVDHLCGNRWCVHPGHLEAVTPKENNRRSNSLSARNSRKTHCKRGHPFNEANTLIQKQRKGRPGVARFCRTCSRERMRARRAAEKAS